jgi:hypothetical protein
LDDFDEVATSNFSDPDLIRTIGSEDADPDSESASGFRRAKMNHKKTEKAKKLHVLKCWTFSFEG